MFNSLDVSAEPKANGNEEVKDYRDNEMKPREKYPQHSAWLCYKLLFITLMGQTRVNNSKMFQIFRKLITPFLFHLKIYLISKTHSLSVCFQRPWGFQIWLKYIASGVKVRISYLALNRVHLLKTVSFFFSFFFRIILTNCYTSRSKVSSGTFNLIKKETGGKKIENLRKTRLLLLMLL